MAINACTINFYTINSAGCRRPFPVRPPSPGAFIGTNNQSISKDFARFRPDLTRHVDEPTELPWTFEVPLITVTAELGGQVGKHSLNTLQSLEVVMASDLTIDAQAASISVNIYDLKIERL